MSGKKSPLMDAWTAWVATHAVVDKNDPKREGKKYVAAMTALMRTSIENQQVEIRRRVGSRQDYTRQDFTPEAPETPRILLPGGYRADVIDEDPSSDVDIDEESESEKPMIRTPAKTLFIRTVVSTCLAGLAWWMLTLDAAPVALFWVSFLTLVVAMGVALVSGLGMIFSGLSRLASG